MNGNGQRRRVLVIHHEGTISSMVRAGQFRDLFARSPEWAATYVSRSSVKLHRWLQRVRRPAIPLMMPLVHRPLAAYAEWWRRRRENQLVAMAANYDVVYVVKSPGLDFYRRLAALGRPRIIADFNDGLWLPYFRNTGWKDLEAILQCAHGVICENDHVADFARRQNPNVVIVPDAPQVDVFDRWRGKTARAEGEVVLGWIGSEENIGHLYRIIEPLEAMAARFPHWRLRIVGARENYVPHFEYVRWSCRPNFDQVGMVQEVLGFDIGLFPLFHLEDGRARGTLKAKVYMSGECVAACEDFGENPKLIRDGENGVLAARPEDWGRKLAWLIENAEARRAIGRGGLETIRSEFTTERTFARLTGAFRQIIDHN